MSQSRAAFPPSDITIEPRRWLFSVQGCGIFYTGAQPVDVARLFETFDQIAQPSARRPDNASEMVTRWTRDLRVGFKVETQGWNTRRRTGEAHPGKVVGVEATILRFSSYIFVWRWYIRERETYFPLQVENAPFYDRPFRWINSPGCLHGTGLRIGITNTRAGWKEGRIRFHRRFINST